MLGQQALGNHVEGQHIYIIEKPIRLPYRGATYSHYRESDEKGC
jgi:hypothetical protein